MGTLRGRTLLLQLKDTVQGHHLHYGDMGPKNLLRGSQVMSSSIIAQLQQLTPRSCFKVAELTAKTRPTVMSAAFVKQRGSKAAGLLAAAPVSACISAWTSPAAETGPHGKAR